MFGISAPRAGMAVRFLAGGNGDTWQQRLVVTPENHLAALTTGIECQHKVEGTCIQLMYWELAES